MTCRDFYKKVSDAKSAGCVEFRYIDSRNGGDREVGFLDSTKIVAQSVFELKCAIAGWSESTLFVGAKVTQERGISTIVLFESDALQDPQGVEYACPDQNSTMFLMKGIPQ